jgi:N-acetylmuramoyl-L-alanine amidase
VLCCFLSGALLRSSEGNLHSTEMVRREGATLTFIRTRILIVLPVVLVLWSACNRGLTNRATSSTPPLRRAEAVLDAVAQTPANAIPDAVLNHTQCLLVFPSRGDDVNRAGLQGIASCRRDAQEWEKPAAVTFAGSRPSEQTDLLVFLLSSSAPGMLRTGHLDLPSAAAGPLVQLSSVVAPVELRSDAVAYVRAGKNLKGVSLGGRIRAEQDQHWPEQESKQYSAALVSFFNIIVPTGIIIHHTATIPGKGRVPASEGEVDQYHQTRGFNVLCFGHEYHVAYHYLVLPDGKIQQGRPERCEGAHAPGYNSYLGISVVGDFSRADNPRGSKGLPRPTQKQIKSLIELCRKLRHQYNIPLQHILRHSDVAPTICPGDRFPFEYLVSQVARVE